MNYKAGRKIGLQHTFNQPEILPQVFRSSCFPCQCLKAKQPLHRLGHLLLSIKPLTSRERDSYRKVLESQVLSALRFKLYKLHLTYSHVKIKIQKILCYFPPRNIKNTLF